MDLSDVIDEMEEASSRADEAKDLAESAVSQLKEKLEEINQLDSDWKEYLDEHVTCSAVADWLVDNADDGALNYVCSASPSYRQKKLESEQVQAVYWEEVEANRLARALMEAAFLAEAKSQTKWVEPLLDKFEQDKVNAHFAESLKTDLAEGLRRADEADAGFARRQKIDELLFRNRSLCSQVRQMQSEIEELRGDA